MILFWFVAAVLMYITSLVAVFAGEWAMGTWFLIMAMSAKHEMEDEINK